MCELFFFTRTTQNMCSLVPSYIVKETPLNGRGLYATRNIPQNELILSSPVAASSLHRKHLPFLCQNCFQYSEDDEMPFEIKCDACSTYYCSATCQKQDLSLHSSHCSLLLQISSTKALKKEESCHVRLVLRMLARCSRDPNVLTSIQYMMKDNKKIPGYKRRKAQRDKAATFFVGMLPKDEFFPDLNLEDVVAANSANSGETKTSTSTNTDTQVHTDPLSLTQQLRASPTFRSIAAVADYLSRGPPNEFAIFDQNGEGCGCAFFPLAALMNHSCKPSAAVQIEQTNMCFYATQEIQAGEQITQSYCNLKGDGRMSRMENIEESWGFKCQCIRCCIDSFESTGNGVATNPDTLQALIQFDQEHMCSCGGVAVPFNRRGSRKGNCQCNSVNLREEE